MPEFRYMDPTTKFILLSFIVVSLTIAAISFSAFLASLFILLLSALALLFSVVGWVRGIGQPRPLCIVATDDAVKISEIIDRYWCGSELLGAGAMRGMFFEWHPLIALLALGGLFFVGFIILLGVSMMLVHQAQYLVEN